MNRITLPSGQKLIVMAMWWGRISAVLGGLLILGIAACIAYDMTLPNGSNSEGMAAGLAMAFLFVAWVAVGFLSLIGAAFSAIAWRKQQSREAQTAFWLCLGNPILGALAFGIIVVLHYSS